MTKIRIHQARSDHTFATNPDKYWAYEHAATAAVITLKEADYQAGQMHAIDIIFGWVNSPHKDYTVKVYSKMSVTIKDEND